METWKAVPGFEGLYEVSDLGRVRSLDRTIETDCRWGGRITRRYRGQILKETKIDGYAHLTLYSPSGDRTAEVHVLVAAAFLGPRPAGQEVCHNGGYGLNNALRNLRYDTIRNNHADKKQHGTYLYGEKHHLAKLTEDDVRRIRLRRGERLQDIADDFGVSRSLVSLIHLRKAWRHV